MLDGAAVHTTARTQMPGPSSPGVVERGALPDRSGLGLRCLEDGQGFGGGVLHGIVPLSIGSYGYFGARRMNVGFRHTEGGTCPREPYLTNDCFVSQLVVVTSIRRSAIYLDLQGDYNIQDRKEWG